MFMETDANIFRMGWIKKDEGYLIISAFFILTDEKQLHIIQVKEDKLRICEDEFQVAIWEHMPGKYRVSASG